MEILQQMMEERSSSKMDQFFKSYGAAEVAAMCFCIAAATSSDPNSVSLSSQSSYHPPTLFPVKSEMHHISQTLHG